MEPHLRKVFESGITRPFAHRERMLVRLKTNILKFEQRILQALKRDLGKCEFEARATETGFVISEISHSLSHLKDWMRPQEFSVPPASLPASSRIVPCPQGAVLIIAPWNYPFQLALTPLVSAIAAGNTAAIKPSDLTPTVSTIIRELIEATFPQGEVRCVEGGIDVTTELLKQPFAHFFFTGSTRVGKIVAHAAAEHQAARTLELGGKSPCIIDNTAHVKNTARRVAWGKSLNAGQTCVAPDFLIVHAEIHDEIIAAIMAEWRHFYGEDPSQSSDYGRIVNTQHFDRVLRLLNSGSGKIYGGRSNRDHLYIEPTLLTDIALNHESMKEEIFGPILPVLKWETRDQLQDAVRLHRDPLAFYVFSTNKAFSDHLIEHESFGGGCVNHIAHHLNSPDLPFGGIRASGTGRYHGKFGFDTFTHFKAVVDANPYFDIGLKYPPYKNRARFLKWLYR